MNPIARMMKRYIKTPLKYTLPLLCIGALVLAVLISGCTVSTQNQATPTAAPTATPTATPTAQATKAPTQATPTPTAAPQSITAQIESYFIGQGYTIDESFAYTKTNSNGYSLYDGMLMKGGQLYSVDVTVCPTSAAAQHDLSVGVTAAGSLGYTGSYTTGTHWLGHRTTDTGTTYSLDLYTTASNWSVMQTGMA